MNTEELFVLASDVQFIPVDDVYQQTKRNFEHDDTDVILTYKHSRKRSRVLNNELASLLKEFETANSCAQAIINFSLQNKQDAAQVAEDAFLLLKEMKREGFLIPYTNSDNNKIAQTLKTGDSFKEYKVKQILQLLDDTEVYRIEDAAGKSYALKLFTKQKNTIASAIKNEINILQMLDGKTNPLFIESGEHNELSYIVMEWCKGVSSKEAAQQYRNYNIKENAIKMMDICIAIVNAYKHLHNQGIMHGDIHPGNVLVTADEKIKIIDFGNSVSKDNDIKQKRAGIDFYYEPEYAAALLQGKFFFPLKAQAEIYSVAALLHLLISGRHYLNFSYEKEKLYQQIIHDAPNSFQSYDLNLPDELDDVFLKALSKDSEQRFSSFNNFANALIHVRQNILNNHNYFITGKANPEEKFIEYLIKKFGYNSRLIKNGLSFSPTSSVNFGAAGIAYMYHRMACVREDETLIDLADIWANRAGNYINNFSSAFYSTTIDINETSVGKRSIYHSPTGVHLVQALISYCKGDSLAVRDAVKNFITAGETPCEKMDLTLGKAGLLIGCALLCNELQPNDHFNLQQVTLFGNAIMQELWTQIDQYPAVKIKANVKYFGMAHGWAGFLYATLLWCYAGRQQLPNGFETRTAQLISSGIETDEIIRWPVSFTNKNSWPGWCHGNSGYIFLLSLLYKYFAEDKFLHLAQKASAVILNNTKNSNINLCCGMSGQAYAFAKLYNVTGEKIYIDEIEKIKQRIIKNIASSSIMNNSLYRGEVGIGVLLVELQKISKAKMPLFE